MAQISIDGVKYLFCNFIFKGMVHIILINKKSCLKNINLIGELGVSKRYIV